MNSILVKYKGHESRVSYNSYQLKIEYEDGANTIQEIIDIEYVYGLHHHNNCLRFYAVTRNNVMNTDELNKVISLSDNSITWGLCTITCEVLPENPSEAIQEFMDGVHLLILPGYKSMSDTKITVICNPTAGSRNALMNWNTIVQPMLTNAGYGLSHPIDLIKTEKDGRTRGIAERLGKTAKELGTTENSLIICMGGDGTIHEVINGLSDMDVNESTVFRFGVVPVGSGNAFALGLGIESIEHATLKIIKGNFKPFHTMDVSIGKTSNSGEDWVDHIEFEDKKKIRLLVVLSWGFHAQIVSKSRYLRYLMGNSRFSLVASFLLIFLQQYEGDLLLKGAKRYQAESKNFGAAQESILIKGVHGNSEESRPFTYFVVSKQHSFEKGFMITPFASSLHEDMDILMMRGASAGSMIKALQEASKSGVHVNDSAELVEYYKVKAALLHIKELTDLCLDGEIHTVPKDGVIELSVGGTGSDGVHFLVSV
ncbi:ATP-NAD kinase-like domain-containing protein [Pilobolus umbonatus]|nr:ATP-NAD kinase-like domain-containing protein [Pilobolus umbonatus]